jgi:hypothetical protein
MIEAPLRLVEIRQALSRARELLLEPTPLNVSLSAAPLADVVEIFKQSGEAERAAMAPSISADLQLLAALLDQAAHFHAELLSRMSAIANASDASAPAGAPRMLVEA